MKKFDTLLHKLRTPIETINMLGCGGIRMGTITECWGPPGGGKSTFCYQTGGYFQQDYPDGFLDILDAENSYDDIRLEHVFGIDVNSPNFRVQPAPTIEDATEKILAGMRRAKDADVPYLCILDSWTVLNTNATIENIEDTLKNPSKVELNMHAGAMMMKPKAGRHWLNAIMTYMYQEPFSILLINQASTSMGKYQATVGSAGGYGLKHDMQFSMSFTKKETIQDGDVKIGLLNTTTARSEVDITKSKFMPDMSGIPIFIDVAAGGKIVPKLELIEVGKAKGIIVKNGSWYKIPGSDKNYRGDDLVDIEGIDKIIKDTMTANLRKDYFLVNIYYQEKEKRLNAATPGRIEPNTSSSENGSAIPDQLQGT